MGPARIARCGLSVALLAASAAVSVAVGPVPFTLQTMVLAMLPVAVGGRDATVSVALYLALGALGLPVFSNFSGGVAVLAGPTGGFLTGFVAGTALAWAVQGVCVLPERVRDVLGAVALLAVSYAMGTLQLMLASGLGPEAALAVAVAPFVVPDAVKAAVGISVGRAVRRALSARMGRA